MDKIIDVLPQELREKILQEAKDLLIASGQVLDVKDGDDKKVDKSIEDWASGSGHQKKNPNQ
jgi:hypothetical protein